MLVYLEANIICNWWTCPYKEKETSEKASAFYEQAVKKSLP